MDNSQFIEKMRNIQMSILVFIDNESDIEENYQNLTNIIDESQIKENTYELKSILYMIVKISNNHNRGNLFFDKFEKIILHLKNDIKKNFSNQEIFQIFKSNKRVLLFLLNENIVYIDAKIYNIFLEKKYKSLFYPLYFRNELLDFCEKNGLNKPNFQTKIPENFEENRQNGENSENISQFIQKDLIDEFISFVNKNEFSVNSSINPSIYETNQFLLKKFAENQRVSLIEYASFYGSIQIFKYLYKNCVELSESLWIYAIHGNHPEIISILEENHIEPNDFLYIECFNEAIKCHHIDTANYIMTNYIHDSKYKDFLNICLKYYNFVFIQKDEIDCCTFPYLCKYDYYVLADLSLKTMNINVNNKKIQ